MARVSKFTEKQVDEIVRLYTEEGLTQNKIREKFRCRGSRIKDALQSRGVNTSNMSVSNRLLNHDYFDTIDTEEKAYFLGLVIADGSVVNSSDGTNRSPLISLEMVDKHIIENFQKALNSGGKIRVDKRKGRNPTYSMSVRSKELAEGLEKHGGSTK